MMDQNDLQKKIFTLVQQYIKPCPLLIWGSGATIPFGMPSMEQLKEQLEITSEENLEKFLSECVDSEKQECHRKNIFKIINEKDSGFRELLKKNDELSQSLMAFVRYFYRTHPQLINIVTTNYDCILEYVLSYDGLSFSDGFSGKEFSKFNASNFKDSEHINLYKVHGSLRWQNTQYSYYNDMMDAIFPAKDKHEKSHSEPFRTIITRSDSAIENSECFLSIGFGFNDDHLTPKIETAIQQKKKPIVVLAKNATENAKKTLDEAAKYILIEEGENKKTKFTFRENDESKSEFLHGEYWKLDQFNEIIGA